ncbi:MAG: hypothetical protein JWM47_1940 [Acidimicrobiales bacterium]|nr:hypothetical protein [Acidimicrobiales bacterium]
MSDFAPGLPSGAVPDPSFVGRGITFPMQVDHTGGISLSRGTDGIDRSLLVILVTAPGERVMRPHFGCKIWELLFEPINHNTLGLMGEAVRTAVARWEPRVVLDDVDLDVDDREDGLVHITLIYTVRTTNDRRNLVFPFYTIPREES